MLTIENLLLSSDIHRLYLIETPQIILLQFLKQWMSSVKTQFSEGKKRAFFSRKNPVFLPSNHNWSVFLLRKNGFAAGFLSGTHCGFTLILRLSTTTCHQYHRFHMAREDRKYVICRTVRPT